MSTNAKVAIELYVDDKGTVRIREFSSASQEEFRKTEKAGVGAAGKIQGAWESLKGAWVGVMGTVMALRETWNMANMAAKAEQEKRSFASLAASYGTSSQVIIANLKKVSGGTIDTMTLIRNAGTAMMMGINPDDVVELMEIARATAKMTGQTTVKAFEDITLAVGRQSKMILDNLGIIVDVEKANEEYAKSLKKTAAQLTDTERKQAFMTATMKAGNELMGKLGKQTDTSADKLERLKATFENIRITVGSGVLKVFYFLDGTFTSVAAAALALSGGIFKIIEAAASLTDKLQLTSGAAAQWKMSATAAFGAAHELAVKADQSFKDMASSNEAVINGQIEFQKKLRETTKTLEEQEKTRKKIVDDHKKEAKEQAEAEKEMYKEAGFGADKYFSKEATELVQKAKRWQKAGADVYQVEEWLYDQLGKLAEDAYAKEEFAAGAAMDSLQAMSQTLVEQYDAANTLIIDQLDEVGVKTAELDGQEIGLSAHFDGSAVVSGIDDLILKFQQLQGAASLPSGQAVNQKPVFENTDSSLSAGQVAAEENAYYNNSNVTVNINQNMSKSDVTSIVNEATRQEYLS